MVATSPVFPDREAEVAGRRVVYPFQEGTALRTPASETVPSEGVKDPTTDKRDLTSDNRFDNDPLILGHQNSLAILALIAS